MESIKHIVVTTDFSKSSEEAFKAAKLLARQFDAQLTLLHVYDPSTQVPPATLPLTAQQVKAIEQETKEKLTEHLEELRERALSDVAEVRSSLLKGRSAAEVICDFARVHEADVVVIATHGRTGLSRLVIGSVAERVVRHAPCAVLTVHAPPEEDAE